MKRKRILKLFSAVLAAALLFTLAGCGDSENSGDSETINFSVGLKDDGTLDGIDPADYVKPVAYDAIQIPESEIAVSDEALQEQIDSILANYEETVEVTDRAIADGDTVNIDYVGRIDGVEFENGSTNGEGTDVTVGETQYIDDFIDQLVGHKPGETFDVNVTFPEDYGDESVDGKDAVFETTINYIAESKLPELTDEFVKENLQESEGYTSVEDMKAKLKEDLYQSNKLQYLYEYILDNSEFQELPEDVVEEQLDLQLKYVESQLSATGATLDQYLESMDYENEDELKDSFRSSIEELVKYYLVCQAIFEEQNMELTDEDTTAFFDSEDVSQYTEYYGEGYVSRLVMDNKVMEYLGEHASAV